MTCIFPSIWKMLFLMFLHPQIPYGSLKTNHMSWGIFFFPSWKSSDVRPLHASMTCKRETNAASNDEHNIFEQDQFTKISYVNLFQSKEKVFITLVFNQVVYYNSKLSLIHWFLDDTNLPRCNSDSNIWASNL